MGKKRKRHRTGQEWAMWFIIFMAAMYFYFNALTVFFAAIGGEVIAGLSLILASLTVQYFGLKMLDIVEL